MTPGRFLWEHHPASPRHRYDSLTGVPAQQRALAFEKASVLFNIGALHTQIGARQDRSCPEGTQLAIEAFQSAAGEGGPRSGCLWGMRGQGQWDGPCCTRIPPSWGCGQAVLPACCERPSAGAFSLLRENFSRAPSPDMSPASLSMLERLMTAQAQECVFEGLLLSPPEGPQDCLAQLRLAQEAAQVRTASPCPAGPSRGGWMSRRAWTGGLGREG